MRDRHATLPSIAKRLKRAVVHMRLVIWMIETGQHCKETAFQTEAVEKTASATRRTMIHDHIDHCLVHGGDHDLAEMRSLAKLF